MAITFATRPCPGRQGSLQMGTPTRADHCVCVDRDGVRDPIFIDGVDECARCGKLPNETIADTWQQRAQAIREANQLRARKRADRKARGKRC